VRHNGAAEGEALFCCSHLGQPVLPRESRRSEKRHGGPTPPLRGVPSTKRSSESDGTNGAPAGLEARPPLTSMNWGGAVAATYASADMAANDRLGLSR
jgi:hypothetical protein